MDLLFFIVSKAGGLALRPETLLLALLAGGVLSTLLGRARLGLWLSGSGVAAALLIAVFPVGAWLYKPLETRFPPRPAITTPPVGILILGGGEELGPAGTTPQLNSAGERYIEVIALARRYPDAWVMFTGGRASLRLGGGENAQHAVTLFRRAGIDPDRIVIETTSRNTVENAAKGLPLRPEGTEEGPWLLVTSAWHMPRALGTFCAAGWQGLVPWPTDFRHSNRDLDWDFAFHLRQLNFAAKEWLGLLGYRVTGRTQALMPKGCPPSK